MKAFIFDFDGVIVDSQQHWDRLSVAHLQKLIPGWTATDDLKMRGHSVEDNYRILQNEYGITFSFEEFLHHVEEMGMEIYRVHAQLNPGVVELLDRLHTIDIPRPSIASASRKSWLDIALRRLGIAEHFDHITTTQEVPKGKPAPDVYLKAAEKLGYAPQMCIAIEDTQPGLNAAKAAGMYCIGYIPSGTENLTGADRIINHFDALTPETLHSLLL